MEFTKKIKTAIIDDDNEYIQDLIRHLNFYPEIEVIGYATQYKKAKEILLKQPDLVFLDIEMPIKNGFELLEEVRKVQSKSFRVVFYTAFDNYTLQALRESALDYIVKPIKQNELKEAIERYKKQTKESAQQPNYTNIPFFAESVALPTSTGIKFLDRRSIIWFQSVKDSFLEKAVWEVLQYDMSIIKLRRNLKAKELETIIGNKWCVRISQSVIINVNYLSAIEFKSRKCILLPPFDQYELYVSRTHMSELKEKFDFI
jgi:two-component system, LytTR family, response regulator